MALRLIDTRAVTTLGINVNSTNCSSEPQNMDVGHPFSECFDVRLIKLQFSTVLHLMDCSVRFWFDRCKSVSIGSKGSNIF